MNEQLRNLQREALVKNLTEFLPNLLFYGIGAVVVTFLGLKLWSVIGYLGVIGFGVLWLLQTFRAIFGTVTGIMVLFTDNRSLIPIITHLVVLIDWAVFTYICLYVYHFHPLFGELPYAIF